ncbi:hypothetical protein BP5796_10568 [Coleophoma crateriformis]|uniref:SH3 domain-containing protein n=1 Tax=Coleophoma crateriformis TaxID=565419 RepID=A0A3D8QQG9_9HELO|nr:hypothetical protein BP5796_10568 [Coleophoma crateriformis]
MVDDVIAPVKSILKAFDNGIKLAKRVSRSAGDAPSAKALEISESTKTLQKALEKDTKAVNDAYSRGVAAFGDSYTKLLTEDKIYQTRLKEVRIELIERINDCPDFEDEPESFESRYFVEIQSQSQICSSACITIFHDLQSQLAHIINQTVESSDRAQLSSIRGIPPSESEPPPTVRKPTPPAQLLEPLKPRSAWDLESTPTINTNATSPALSPTQVLSGDVSPLDEPLPQFIPSETVNHRLSANDEWLERRRQSRLLWMDQKRQSSIGSISENQYAGSSPISPPLAPMTMTSSPVEPSRLSGNSFSVAMARNPSQASHDTRSSRTSSLLHDIPERPRHDSIQSQESLFGLRASLPLSPPLSEHHRSGPDWGPIATTLHVPGFGHGVEDGLEVARLDDDRSGLILANEDQAANQNGGAVQPTPPTPTTSIRSNDYVMRHDASFYRFGGFCDGARAILRGDPGFKIVKRPSGHYSATISARCIKCSYEVGYKDVEKDEKMERAGIYGNCGIRWRQRFITKCHLKTNSVDDPVYACIFCVEENKTVEEHDATIFFSVTGFFRHLATHQRPLPTVRGVTVVYGAQPPTMLDFDLHFPSSVPTKSEFCLAAIAQKVTSRAAAYASTTHHPKNKHSTSLDPEGNPALHFASGARIVGITFPSRFKGEWCTGYHDGQKGSFPASAIMLDIPSEPVLMSPQSQLIATARWDFKPKDAKEGGWLKLSKGERVTNIGYSFQDQWCWSGQSSKGKWGLFPAAFVEDLREATGVPNFSTSPSSLRSRMSSFSAPLRRPTSSRVERSASLRSNGSGGSMIAGVTRPSPQPGLEIAPTGSGWRGH